MSETAFDVIIGFIHDSRHQRLVMGGTARRTGSKEKELPVPKGTVFSMWKLVGW